jgi:hypothetical protein
LAISGLTALVLCAVAVAFALRGGEAPLHGVPVLASSAIAWGGGFLQAVVVAMNALRRDRAEGIVHLFVTRTSSVRGYVIARVGGLAALLFAVVGGGSLLVSIVAILAAAGASAVTRTFGAAVAALVFALAFAVVIAPVAFATLGARPRASGYLVLLLVLVFPEVLAGKLGGVFPSEVTELCAIPSALDALRSSLLLGSFDPFRTLRALVALAIFVGVASFFVRRDVLRLEREGV